MYKVKTYVAHGYYEYEVSDMAQAIAHGQAIMASGVYRHAVDGGVEFHHPYKVKVTGPGLETEYPDVFKRT
jgi:hypothetical protein